MLQTTAVAGIVAGTTVGTVALMAVALVGIRKWIQGPTKGTDNPKRLDNKVVVITGCNTGIGKVTAQELSRRGAKIIMLCRNMDRAEETAEEIRQKTRNKVVVMHLDLASLKSIRSCANQLIQQEVQIDILINNAGIMACPEMRTEDGFEQQIGTNHLGHFLLTELLLPKLKNSASNGFNARIVIVSSVAHLGGNIRWDDLNFETPGSYSPARAYFQSKLANVMHGAALARKLQGTGITVYSLHPGVIDTELTRHIQKSHWLAYSLLGRLYRYLIKTPFHGAQTTLYCCLEDKLSGVSGKYYSDCVEARPKRQALDIEDQEKLWKMSCDMVGIKTSVN